MLFHVRFTILGAATISASTPPTNAPAISMCTQITHRYLCGHDVTEMAPCALMRIHPSEVHAPVARTIRHEEICEKCEGFVRDCGLVVEYHDRERVRT